MDLRMDGWKVSLAADRAKIVKGPAWAVVTFYRTYDGKEAPEPRVVESLHRDRPNLEPLVDKYQFPAPGSVKQYDFAYGRMLSGVSAGATRSYGLDPRSERDGGYASWDAEDLPGVERVYRKVEAVRLTDAEIRELYVDWARGRVLKDPETPGVDFALHVLAELGGEP
jgi:hypothetical protein